MIKKIFFVAKIFTVSLFLSAPNAYGAAKEDVSQQEDPGCYCFSVLHSLFDKIFVGTLEKNQKASKEEMERVDAWKERAEPASLHPMGTRDLTHKMVPLGDVLGLDLGKIYTTDTPPPVGD